MAFRLLIASLVGASGVSGLASAGDIELMHMLKTTDTNASRQSSSVSSTVVSSKKSWLCTLKVSCTAGELQQVTNEFDEGFNFHPYVRGSMTDEGLNQMLSTYPDLMIKCEEDPFSPRLLEKPLEANFGERRQTFPWGIVDIGADVQRGRGVGVNVYVLDSGIRISHSLFGGRARASLDMTAAFPFTCSPTDTTCAADGHGHGTHVAGTVGATTFGVADGATLWAMKVLQDNNMGYNWWVVYAMTQVRLTGARPAVVSMSLGADVAIAEAPAQKQEIDYLVDGGVTVVVAAGNNNGNACDRTPPYVPLAITVASYAEGGAKSSFSNYGPCIDLWAPGSDIFSLSHVDDTSEATNSGTSMACPHVSGLAAIMYQDNPTAESMTASQRFDLLTASQRTGYVTGIPTTLATVNLVALAPTPTPATPSPPTPPTPGTPASAVGDPHMQNVHGERFDLMKPGMHVMLNIPRGMSAENALLRVQAKAVRLGEHCADMYFQELNITGSWAGAKQIGGYNYVVTQQAATAPAWLSFGPMFREVKVKVVHGVTEGGLKYLNFYVKNLGNVGLAVGGLLGEDDHEAVSTPSGHCGLLLSMAQSADTSGPVVTSVAAASFD